MAASLSSSPTPASTTRTKGSKNISHASSKLTPCFLAFVVAFASSRQNAASDKGTRHPLNLCIYNVYLAGQAPSLPTTKPRHLDRRRRFCRRSGEIPVFRLCRCFSSTASFPQPNLVKPQSPHLLIPQSDTSGVLVISASYNPSRVKKAPVHDRGFSH